MKIIAFAILFLCGVAHAQSPAVLLEDAAKRPMITLDQIQQLAAANNPTLKQSPQLFARSVALARQAGFYPNPSVGYQGEQIRGGTYGGGEQGGYIQQTIPLGGKLGLRRLALDEQRKQDEIGIAEQQARVRGAIGQLYYQGLSSQELVKLRLELATVAKDAVTTAHQLANVGQADLPDVLLAEVEAEQSEVDYASAQWKYIQDFQMLTAAAGQPGMPLAYLAGDLQKLPVLDTTQVLESILRDSPEVRSAQQGIVRMEAELKSAHRESVPDLTLRAGLQQNLEHLSDTSNHAVGLQGFASAGITLPIFNRNQGNVEAAKAELERARQERIRVELTIRSSVQPLVQMFLAQKNQSDRYRTEIIPRADRAYQLYLAKYQTMALAYPQVLMSQRTLFQLKTAYIQSLARVWFAAIQLQNYALAGALDRSAITSSSPINVPVNPGQ